MNNKKDNPSRQKPVNVVNLIERKERYKKYKKDNPPYYFKDKPHQDMFGGNSPYKFWQRHGRDWVFNRCSNWTSNNFTIPEHKLAKMEPYDRHDHHNLIYSDKECLCLVKWTSKRKHFCEQKDWNEIIEIIKKFSTFIHIMFCTSYDGRKSAKIRQKEIDFICNAGCKYLGHSDMTITDMSHEECQWIKDEMGNSKNERVKIPKRKFIAEGYLFEIK